MRPDFLPLLMLLVLTTAAGTPTRTGEGGATLPQKTVQVDRMGPVTAGGRAPWLAGFDLAHPGRVINLTSILEKNDRDHTLIVFWATWCPPCLDGLERLRKAEGRLRAARIGVVLVAVADDPEKAKQVLGKRNIRFPALSDGNGVNARRYGILPRDQTGPDGLRNRSLPWSFLVDGSGEVEAIYGAEGRDWIDRILEAARP